VLRLLGGGLSEREIAGELVLSFHTVHSHVKSAYRKLGVSSRAEALARVREDGGLP
jgi:LuxR family transcriptional regulator, maltose regulon positive regulatory protein